MGSNHQVGGSSPPGGAGNGSLGSKGDPAMVEMSENSAFIWLRLCQMETERGFDSAQQYFRQLSCAQKQRVLLLAGDDGLKYR